KLRLSEDVARVEKTGGGLSVTFKSGATSEFDCVMAAIGRVPNTAGLGLETAGVELDEVGSVLVDAYSQSSVPNIYAIGDVTNRLNLTPVAIREGHAFADTVYGKRKIAVDHAMVPTAVFSQPAIGCVGYTEEAARAKFGALDIYRASFRPLKATLS